MRGHSSIHFGTEGVKNIEYLYVGSSSMKWVNLSIGFRGEWSNALFLAADSADGMSSNPTSVNQILPLYSSFDI